VALGLHLSPLVVWPFAWRKLILAGEIKLSRTISPVLLLKVLGSASYAFMWSGILPKPHSAGRTITIVVNGIVVIAVGVSASFQTHHARGCLVLASFLTTLSWLFLLALGLSVLR